MSKEPVADDRVSTERADCAGRLERLAQDPRFDARAEDLRSLAAAVRDQGDGSWTGVDLIGAFPAEASINVGKQHWFERVISIAAGASVFLPVAWTWWSISIAAEAYSELIAEDDETGRTFLSMWTTGFDGRLDGVHLFGPTAVIAFSLVAIAVLLVVLNRWVSDHYMFREETSGGQARRELVATLGRAQRFLNVRRTDDPRFLEAALKRSVAELNEAHAATLAGVQELREATASALVEFGQASTKMVKDVRPLLQSADQASRVFAKSAESASGLQEKVMTSAQQFDKTLRSALTSFQESVATSSSQLADSTQSATAGVTDAVADLSKGVSELQVAQADTKDLLRDGIRAQAYAVEASSRAASELARILEGHQSSLQGQSSDLSRAADLAGQLLDELRARGH